jgi:hypothetical protein
MIAALARPDEKSVAEPSDRAEVRDFDRQHLSSLAV